MRFRRVVQTMVCIVLVLGYVVEGKAYNPFATMEFGIANIDSLGVTDTSQTPATADKKAARFAPAVGDNVDTAVGQSDAATGQTDTLTTRKTGEEKDSSESLDMNTGQTDTSRQAKSKKPPYRHQIRLGVDLARVGFNFMFPSRVGVEFQADYALRKNDVYLAAEAGYGQGNIDYSFLKYTTQSTFVRLGIEKSFLDKVGDEDFDIGFLGFRYGIASGSYSDAEFSVTSPFGGRSEGEEPGRNFVVHWGEIVGGIKVEVWRGIFLGWTVRGKFLFNPKQFPSIAPNYIAGYGKGDRTSVFDFSFYLSYALRWTK